MSTKQGFRGGKVIVFMYQRNSLHVLWNPRAHDRFQENKSLSFIPSHIIQCIKFHPVSVGSILILFCLRQGIPRDLIPRGCISVQGCFTNVVKKRSIWRCHVKIFAYKLKIVRLLVKGSFESVVKICLRRCARCQLTSVGVSFTRGMLPFRGRRHFVLVSLGTLAETLASLLSELPELLSPLHLRYFWAGPRKRSSSVSS